MKTAITLGDHFTYKKILRFTMSPILMMVFSSLYGIVDGLFISKFAGAEAYAGATVIFPLIMIIGGMGFMFACGGAALTSMYLGKGDQNEANRSFTVIFKTLVLVAICVSMLGFSFAGSLVTWLGSLNPSTTPRMIVEGIKYGQIMCAGQGFFIIQTSFQNYLVVDEKPKLGFKATLCAGITNMVLDALFVGVFKWGVVGAAVATILGYVAGIIIPLVHFLSKKSNTRIRFIKAKYDLKIIAKACFNGCSEFVSNISSSVVSFIFNVQLMKMYADAGVAAHGTIMYIEFIFLAVYIGYSIGISPVVAYNYGAENKEELNNVLKKSLLLILTTSICMVGLSEVIGPLFSKLYLSNNPEALEITIKAFKVYSFVFMFSGFGIFMSGFFTALNNGLISAIISFSRTFVLQSGFLLLLPTIFSKEILWACPLFSDSIACLMSFIFLIALNRKYGYFIKNKKMLL